MQLVDNEWGFDVTKTPPFLAFTALRKRAIKDHGEAAILDLSQGEPGYGFAPSSRSRRFYAFLLLVDTFLNNNERNLLFSKETVKTCPEIVGKLRVIAEQNFSPQIAAELIQDLDFFLERLREITKKQGQPQNDFEILYSLFKYSILSGGRYPDPWGEELVRMVVADLRTREFGFPVNFQDLILLNGASHGVGTFFSGFGEEGLNYLKRGDTILMVSPVYAPYTQFVEDRGLKLVNVAIDSETGKIDEASFAAALNSAVRIKAIVLVDPSNPSGFSLSQATLTKLTEIAEKHNSLILSDEVYAEFFQQNFSLVQIPAARKRLIRLSALSKTERSTGIRFGDLYLAPEARKFITTEILEKDCPGFQAKYKDVQWFFFLAKSYGGRTIGVFQHIAGVPGPSQVLGLCHLILSTEERAAYFRKLEQKVQAFYAALDLPHYGNNYYGTFDLAKIEGPQTAQKPIEKVLSEIADQGVILMPACLFFSAADRAKSDKRRFVRVSLPNLPIADLARAAKLIRKCIEA